jgi:hypothetical protein
MVGKVYLNGFPPFLTEIIMHAGDGPGIKKMAVSITSALA